MTETPAAPATRGRPRPQTTIDRDQRVLDALRDPAVAAQGLTRTEVVERVPGEKPSHVDLSLFRLRRSEQVSRVQSAGQHRWVARA